MAECVEVCVSAYGATAAEALSNLTELLTLYFSKGAPLPRFIRPAVEFIDVELPRD